MKPIPDIQRKRGRPATGQAPVTAIRLPDALVEEVRHWAKLNGIRSRSEAIRQLIVRALRGRRG